MRLCPASRMWNRKPGPHRIRRTEMHAEYRNPTHRAAIEKQAHVLRTLGGYGWFAAGRLAAQEREQRWMADAATSRQLRASGTQTTAIAALVTAMREAIGTALGRAVDRCRVGVTPDRDPRMEPSTGATASRKHDRFTTAARG